MHPTDDLRQAWMDGELDRRAEERVASHLQGCSECREAVAAGFARREELRRLFAGLAPPSTADQAAMLEVILRRGRLLKWRRAALIAASVLFTVIGTAAAARSPSIRGFVRALFEPPRAALPAIRVGPAATTNGVAVPAGPVVDIRFRSGQSTGLLTVILGESTTAAIAASDSVGYLIRPDGVVVLNQGSQASYTVTLPLGASQVTIRVGDLVVFRKLDASIEAVGAADPSHRYLIPLAQTRTVRSSPKTRSPGGGLFP